MGRALDIAALVLVAACDDAPPTPPPATVDATPPVAALPALDPDPAEETGCVTTAAPPGRARARRVACASDLAAGPLAMGRVGDVLLENARVRYVLRAGSESATTIGAPGGGLIDAVTLDGARVDGVKEVIPVLNLHGLAVGPLVVVRAAGPEVVVRAAFAPRPLELIASVLPLLAQRPAVRGVLEYTLGADAPALGVRVCAVPEAGSGTIAARPGLVALLGGAFEVLAPGVGVLDGDTASGVAPALLAESPASAFGAALGDGPASILHVGTVTLMDATARVDFPAGALRCAAMRLVVGATGRDAAAALGPPGARTLDVPVPPGGRAEVLDPAGRVVLRSRETGGRVLAPVNDGAYTTRVARAGGAFGDPAAPPPVGVLAVRARVEGEPGAPVRVTVRGLDGLAHEARFVVADEGRRSLPAGRYRVSATRGGEYTAATEEVTVADGAEARFAPTLARVVDTRGYVATDFHLHTELSTDSAHAVEDAVRQMAAEGLEVVAGTDHDFVADLAAVARAAGVEGWITAVSGEEVSTTRLGHFGGYPLRRDEARAGAGAVPWFGRAPGELFRALRAAGDDVVVQVNHPRLRGSGFFDQIDIDPATGAARADPVALGLPPGADLADLSFDAVEVWNGYTRGGNERSFADWLALRAAGRRWVMVGNSDSHRPDRPPGAPRSYVRVPDDARGRVTWDAVRGGLRGGDVAVSAGLFVEVRSADGARPGGTGAARGGRVVLRVRVQAPPWADCRRLRVYRGTEVVLDRRLDDARDRVVRFDEDVVVEVRGPTFVVVRADGEADADPVFPFPPFGVTNALAVAAP